MAVRYIFLRHVFLPCILLSAVHYRVSCFYHQLYIVKWRLEQMYSMTARGPRTETQRILRKINGPSKGIPDGSFCLYNIEYNYPLDSFLMYRMDSYFVVSAQYCVVVIL